jgi:hypothetical protein
MDGGLSFVAVCLRVVEHLEVVSGVLGRLSALDLAHGVEPRDVFLLS